MDYSEFLQSRPTTSIPRENDAQYKKIKQLIFEILKVLNTGNKQWNSTYVRELLSSSEIDFMRKVINGGNVSDFEWKVEYKVQQMFKIKVYKGLESQGDTLILHKEYETNFPRRTNMLGKFKHDDIKSYMYKWQGKDKYTTKVYSASANGWKFEFSFE